MKFIVVLRALQISIAATFILSFQAEAENIPQYVINLSFIITLLLSAITIARFTQFLKVSEKLDYHQSEKHRDDISHIYPINYTLLDDKGNDELSELCRKVNALTSSYRESQKYHMYTEKEFIKTLDQQKNASTKSFHILKESIDQINDDIRFLHSDLCILQYNGVFNADIIDGAVSTSKNASDNIEKLATRLEDKKHLEPKPKYELFNIDYISKMLLKVHTEPTSIDIGEGIEPFYFSLDASLHRVLGIQFKRLLIGESATSNAKSYRRSFSFNGTAEDKVLTMTATVRCHPKDLNCKESDLGLIEDIMNGCRMIQPVGLLKHEEVANLYGIIQRTNIKIVCHWIDNVLAEISFIHITPLIESVEKYEALLEKKSANIIPIGQAINGLNKAG
jgi:hypothetical protein